jgi:hypothetical protein
LFAFLDEGIFVARQDIELIPTSAFDLNQVRNFISSVELRTSARIKKPVSKWIIAYERVVAPMMRDAQREIFEPMNALWRLSASASPASDPGL